MAGDTEKKAYLGDGAYAEVTDFGDLCVFTSDGVHQTNTVFLGALEITKLFDFAHTHGFITKDLIESWNEVKHATDTDDDRTGGVEL